jgi:hypothetical protein
VLVKAHHRCFLADGLGLCTHARCGVGHTPPKQAAVGEEGDDLDRKPLDHLRAVKPNPETACMRAKIRRLVRRQPSRNGRRLRRSQAKPRRNAAANGG